MMVLIHGLSFNDMILKIENNKRGGYLIRYSRDGIEYDKITSSSKLDNIINDFDKYYDINSGEFIIEFLRIYDKLNYNSISFNIHIEDGFISYNGIKGTYGTKS